MSTVLQFPLERRRVMPSEFHRPAPRPPCMPPRRAPVAAPVSIAGLVLLLVLALTWSPVIIAIIALCRHLHSH